ncbi:MAG: hypothetical protein VST72_00210 [Nitrospirota bacterium]|nr:hypothetical protein [Nitrospirota bacterium]
MDLTKTICSICAWRENCRKKFSVSGKDIRCADFVKDMSIQDNKPGENEADRKEENKEG